MARTLKSAEDRTAAREKILRAAHDAFVTDGYRAASLDSVAARAGTTRSALLYHYRNKEVLLQAVLDARDDEFGIPSDRFVPPGPSSSTLFQTIGGTIARALNDRELVALAHSLSAEAANSSHPAHDWLVRRSRTIRNSIAADFQDAFDRGELASVISAQRLAALCLGVVEGLEAQWLADPDEIDVLASLGDLELLINGALSPLNH